MVVVMCRWRLALAHGCCSGLGIGRAQWSLLHTLQFGVIQVG